MGIATVNGTTAFLVHDEVSQYSLLVFSVQKHTIFQCKLHAVSTTPTYVKIDVYTEEVYFAKLLTTNEVISKTVAL